MALDDISYFRLDRSPFITITKQHSSAIVPSIENLLLEHDFGDQVLWRIVDQIRHGETAVSSRDRKIADLFAHLLRSLGTPLRVAEGVVLFRGLGIQMVP